jgi:hypothetical protein
MTDTDRFHKGDRVHLICDLVVAPIGTVGEIVSIRHDADGQVTTLDILISVDAQHTFGTGVFPREIELVPATDSEAQQG